MGWESLNSTMVRLQLSNNLELEHTKAIVSIPQWFDYNKKFQLKCKECGASLNSTMVRLQP